MNGERRVAVPLGCSAGRTSQGERLLLLSPYGGRRSRPPVRPSGEATDDSPDEFAGRDEQDEKLSRFWGLYSFPPTLGTGKNETAPHWPNMSAHMG